jgi:hypothetical protein
MLEGVGGQAADSDWSVHSPHPIGMTFESLKLWAQIHDLKKMEKDEKYCRRLTA